MDCRQLVEHGCLGYLIMALSSLVEEMRSAAGHALTRFSHHLQGSRFREKAQVWWIFRGRVRERRGWVGVGRGVAVGGANSLLGGMCVCMWVRV